MSKAAGEQEEKPILVGLAGGPDPALLPSLSSCGENPFEKAESWETGKGKP